MEACTNPLRSAPPCQVCARLIIRSGYCLFRFALLTVWARVALLGSDLSHVAAYLNMAAHDRLTQCVQ